VAIVNTWHSLINQARLDTAVSLLQRGEAWYTLGKLQAIQDNDETAIMLWRQADDQAAIREMLLAWAALEQRWGDRQTALRWYERLVLLDPETADAWYFTARLLEQDGERVAAITNYEIAFSAPRLEQVGRSDIALQLGMLAFAAENWAGVDNWLNLALDEPDFRIEDRAWEAHYIRAESWRLRGNLAMAAPDYQWVVSYYPNHYWANIRLAQVYWQLEDNQVMAEQLLQQAIDIDPDRKWSYRLLADLYRENDQIQEAIKLYQIVLTLDPQDMTHLLIGM